MLTQLPKEITLIQRHQLDILEIRHPKVNAAVALQGAQLLSWQPSYTSHDVLWLSEIEPYIAGNAIRGGVPICYPWFGGIAQPSHGTARLRVWALVNAHVDQHGVKLHFRLDEEAEMEMALGAECSLTFTHLSEKPAQVALHSYFNVSDIEKIALHYLPECCFDSLTQQEQAVALPRKIAKNVDEIYPATAHPTCLVDEGYQRQIAISHHNASQIVVWNPWHKITSGMSETGYRTMVCVETARIHTLLAQGEQLTAKFQVQAQ